MSSPPIVDYADPLEGGPVTDPPSCSLWVNGVRFADGQPEEDPLDPVVLTDLRVTWGRANALDQPAPSTATFSVQDLAGGQRFLELLKLGARVDVRADAVIYPDPTIPMLPDPGFAGGVGSRYASAGLGLSVASGRLVVTPAPGVRYGTVYFPPAPLSSDPSAWNAVARSRPGQSWAGGATVTTTNDLGSTVQAARLRAAYYRNPNGSGVELSPGLLAVSAATPGDNVLGPVQWVPPDDYWVGLALEINPTGPAWNELDGRSWDSLGGSSAPGVLRTNRALNPAYELGTLSMYSNGPSLYVPTADTTAPIAGTRSLLTTRAGTLSSVITSILCTAMANNTRYPVTAGSPVTGGISIKTDVANARIFTQWYWYDAVGTLTQGTAVQGVTAAVAGTTYRLVNTATPPAGTVSAYFVAYVQPASGNAVVGQRVWVDLLTLEDGATSGSYFDGSTPDTADLDYAWTGAANASTSTATGLTTPTLTNLCQNPTPASVTGWLSNNGAQHQHTYAAGEISVNRQAAAAANIAASWYNAGRVVPDNPVLTAGVNYQRSIEIWVDAAATTQTVMTGFVGGDTLPANTWTRIVQQFTGTGAAAYVMGLNVLIPGVGTGVHVKLRRAQLVANPSGVTLPYFDGSTPDTASTDYAWTGAANASTSTATPITGTAWQDLSIVRVDDLVLQAPAAGQNRSGLVFSGLITDMDASYSLGLGGTLVKVIAQDWTADLANRFVGDTPWAKEALGSRFAKIIAAAGQQTTYQIDPAPAALQVTYRDVDSSASLLLLQELARTAGGVLWSATNLVTGPYLWLEDVDERLPLLELEEDAGGIVRIVTADLDTIGAITLSACSVALEPVHWIQTSDDDGTRVVASWLEQLLDNEGHQKPTMHEETVADAAAEAATGVRRVAISTQLTTSTEASTLAARLLARLRTPGWRITGLELNLNQYERLNADGLTKIMTLLDGTTRIGCPILLTDLPEWSPVGAAVNGSLPLYLEGARFTSSDGYWQLELLTSDGGSTGSSVKWNELAAGWTWNEFDPAITWISLTGVGV